MSERDFEFKNLKFKLNKLNTIKQFHISRKISPILSEMLPLMGTIVKTDKRKDLSDADKFQEFAKIGKPILDGFSKLSDADAEYVLFNLLSGVEMQQGPGNWARVATDTMILFENLELPVLFNIAGKSFMYNLSGFFAALPQS